MHASVWFSLGFLTCLVLMLLASVMCAPDLERKDARCNQDCNQGRDCNCGKAAEDFA